MIRRLFVAHPKQLPDDELDDLVNWAKNAFAGRTLRDGSEVELEITTGRMSAAQWERDHRGLPFNWQSWTELVTGSTSPFGGEPRFHYFLVGPTRVLGRATAGLIQLALARKRQVFWLDEDHKLRQVTTVLKVNEGNWKASHVAMV